MSEELIALLDPKRDYGDRTFEDVVAGVRDGTVLIREGQNLPVLQNALIGDLLKGTGQPVQRERRDTIAWGKREFANRAAQDFQGVYGRLVLEAKKGNMKAQAIFWDHFLGRPKEAPSGDVPEVVRTFLEHMERREPPSVPTVISDPS